MSVMFSRGMDPSSLKGSTAKFEEIASSYHRNSLLDLPNVVTNNARNCQSVIQLFFIWFFRHTVNRRTPSSLKLTIPTSCIRNTSTHTPVEHAEHLTPMTKTLQTIVALSSKKTCRYKQKHNSNVFFLSTREPSNMDKARFVRCVISEHTAAGGVRR